MCVRATPSPHSLIDTMSNREQNSFTATSSASTTVLCVRVRVLCAGAASDQRVWDRRNG